MRHHSERIRSAIHASSFDMNGQHIAGSTRIGIARHQESIDAAGEVPDETNVALYRSQASRDRATVDGGDFETVKQAPDTAAGVIFRVLHPSPAISSPARSCVDATA
jgi:hypothetical protein